MTDFVKGSGPRETGAVGADITAADPGRDYQAAGINNVLTILDKIDTMIYVTDLEYNIIYTNRIMSETFCSGGGASTKCWQAFFKGRTEPCEFCDLPGLLCMNVDNPERESERFYGGDAVHAGRDFWVSVKTHIINWADGRRVQLCVGTDITARMEYEDERKRYEQELRDAAMAAVEASRMKTSFLANMSHEIRTPMNGIIGFAELAVDDNVAPRTKDYLEKIKTSALGLLQIIDDILDISKIEAGKMALEHIPFSLGEVLKNCEAISSPKAVETGVVLYFYPEPEIDRNLVGDPTKLRQILLNLLSNAIKFANRGMVKIIAELCDITESTASIKFEVKDNGIGMTPEQVKEIFEPFVQADSTTTRKYGGTGLGLAITKNLIEQMGGELEVESAKGVGSVFSFTLTFETQEIVEESTEGAETPDTERHIFSGDVLVCEDNVINQMVISEHLAKIGLSAAIADNGKIGVEMALSHMRESSGYDLVFMDIHMPVMDGLEATERLLEAGFTAPIIALTASAMTSDREAYLARGMTDLLAKPVTAKELRACLSKYMPLPAPLEEAPPEDFMSKFMDPANIYSIIDRKAGLEHAANDVGLYERIIVNFVKENKTVFNRINEAVYSENLALAHRLSHTLKGTAKTIGATKLAEAAYTIETELKRVKPAITNEHMKTLKAELKAVLAELSFADESTRRARDSSYDAARLRGLAEKLKPLLQAGDTDCMDLIPEIEEAVPPMECTAIVSYMEDYNFDLALEVLNGILEGGSHTWTPNQR